MHIVALSGPASSNLRDCSIQESRDAEQAIRASEQRRRRSARWMVGLAWNYR